MKACMAGLLAVAGASLTACAPLGLPGDLAAPPAHRLSLGGQSYLVRQITDSTWTVTSTASRAVLASTAGASAALRQAVEIASGCKVTDSDYSSQGRQFDAQVECPGALAR